MIKSLTTAFQAGASPRVGSSGSRGWKAPPALGMERIANILGIPHSKPMGMLLSGPKPCCPSSNRFPPTMACLGKLQTPSWELMLTLPNQKAVSKHNEGWVSVEASPPAPSVPPSEKPGERQRARLITGDRLSASTVIASNSSNGSVSDAESSTYN